MFHTASGVALLYEAVVGLGAHTLRPSGSGPPALLCSWEYTPVSPREVLPVKYLKICFSYFYLHVPICV